MSAPAAIVAAARANAPAPVAGLRPIVLGPADVERILALHEQAWAASPPGTVRHDGRDFFAAVLAGQGAILGWQAIDGALAAYGVLTLPGPDEPHYGRLARLPEAEWPLIAHLEGIAVAVEWRGDGLQRSLGRWRMDTAAQLGRRHLCATAAPHNFPSWRNLMQLGFVIRGLAKLYGGDLRYILHCDLAAGPVTAPLDEVPVDDLDRHRALLDQGCPAVGWKGEPKPQSLLFASAPGGR